MDYFAFTLKDDPLLRRLLTHDDAAFAKHEASVQDVVLQGRPHLGKGECGEPSYGSMPGGVGAALTDVLVVIFCPYRVALQMMASAAKIKSLVCFIITGLFIVFYLRLVISQLSCTSP